MKKNVKVWIAIACVVAIIGSVVGGLVGFAQGATDKSVANAEAENWMRFLGDEIRLKDVVIPGSHDAGSVGMMWMAETQNRTVKEQLSFGVRYFDLRVTEDKNGKLVINHDVIKGQDFDRVLTSIDAFLSEHPTECVLLDFQHFGENMQEKALERAKEAIGKYMIVNDTDKDDLTFADELTVRDARGKALVFVGEDKTFCEQSCFFYRSGDAGNEPGSSLQSYYDAAYNEGKVNAYVDAAIPFYISRFKEYNKGFFVLQGQLTDKIRVLGPRFKESQNRKNMDAYVKGLKTSKDLAIVNVLLRDFLTPEKTAAIIVLNERKGLVRVADIDAFLQAFA